MVPLGVFHGIERERSGRSGAVRSDERFSSFRLTTRLARGYLFFFPRFFSTLLFPFTFLRSFRDACWLTQQRLMENLNRQLFSFFSHRDISFYPVFFFFFF